MFPLSTKSKASIACYAAILPALVKAGWKNGYVIAVHGSFRRDLDIVAVPWVENAASDEALIKALAETCDGEVVCPAPGVVSPHGRRSWQIHLGGPIRTPYDSGPYIDVNVWGPSK